MSNGGRTYKSFIIRNMQGWEGSRYSLGRAWIEAIFWYLVHKRHFLLILKILYAYWKSLDTVSVSESPTQIFCIGNSLGTHFDAKDPVRREWNRMMVSSRSHMKTRSTFGCSGSGLWLLRRFPRPRLELFRAENLKRREHVVFLVTRDDRKSQVRQCNVWVFAVAKRIGNLPFRTKTNIRGSTTYEDSYSYEYSFTTEYSAICRIFGHFTEYMAN